MVWLILGILLLIWSVSEFISGKTWSYREINRKFEPAMFWAVSLFWFCLSLTLILPYIFDLKY